MNPITPDEYDAVVDQWKEWQSYPWGKLLYSISHSNIQRHIDHHPLRILDVGGGNGFDSVFFAKQGHSVALLDYSPRMLYEAKQAAEEEDVLERISFYRTDVSDILDFFHGQQFDLIICHLMLEFVTAPQQAMNDICTLMGQSGLLSIVDANRYSEVYRRAIQLNDLEAALQAIDTREYFHPWFDRLTPLLSSAEMLAILRGNSCDVVGDYGIRCLCDYLPNKPKYESEYYRRLEQLEFKLSGAYPYNLLARFYQVIVQKKKLED